MGVPGPGLHRGFRQLGVSAYTMHDQFIPPPPPAPPIPFVPGLIEIPGFMDTPVSVWTRKASGTVFFDGGEAVQEGHDMGFMIPHFAIPMNVLCGVHTALSKHKILVPVQKVKIEQQSMGSYLLFGPGQICADPVSLPTAVVILTKGTVWSTVTLADVGAAVWTSVQDAVLDLVWRRLLGGQNALGKPNPLDDALSALTKRAFNQVSGRVWRTAATSASELLSSATSKFLKDVVWEGVLLDRGHPFLEGGGDEPGG